MTAIQFQLWSDNQSILEEHSPYLKNRSHTPMNANEVKIVDLFSGIGGFHIGFEHAAAKLGMGLKLQFASDIDEAANDVYEKNFGKKPLGDINDIGDAEADDADLISGGFPCQPFSNSGMKKGFSDDRGTLFDHIERMIKASRPKAFLLENVAGILHNGKGHTANSRLHADGHAKRIGEWVAIMNWAWPAWLVCLSSFSKSIRLAGESAVSGSSKR